MLTTSEYRQADKKKYKQTGRKKAYTDRQTKHKYRQAGVTLMASKPVAKKP